MSAEERVEEISRATVRDWVLIRAVREDGGVMAESDKIAALLDAVRVLNGLGLPCALIGGVAVGIHSGVPRATLGTDFAVPTSFDRVRLIDAMMAAGFRLVGEHDHSINFRHSGGEPVQLAFDRGFDAMIDRAATIDVRGCDIAIVRKEDLIAMKRRAAADPSRRKSKALRDQADVELLLGDLPDPDEGW
jgi:hypothetical protein